MAFTRYNGKVSGVMDNGHLLTEDIREKNCFMWAPRLRHMECIVARLATMVSDHLSTLGSHFTLSIHEILKAFVTPFLMRVKWCLDRTFCLWSYPRQMPPLAVRPIKRSRVGCHAILQSIASAIFRKNWQGGDAYIPHNYSSRRPLHSDLEVLA